MQQRLFIGALMLIMLMGLVGCASKPDRTEITRASDTSHYIIINGCDAVEDAYDAFRKTEVPRGHFAVWINQTNDDYTLKFGPDLKLFKVRELFVPARDQRSLQVLEDAHPTDPGALPYEHEYQACTANPQPGPVIIVPPPGGD